MFSTGNFKNSVGSHKLEPIEPRENEFKSETKLQFKLGKDFAWAAMDETSKKDSENIHLAPTVVHSSKAMFIVRVSYFVHVALFFGLLTRPVILKLPFLLKRPTKYSSVKKEKEKEKEKGDAAEKAETKVSEIKNEINVTK